jgi:hypothetical protein
MTQPTFTSKEGSRKPQAMSTSRHLVLRLDLQLDRAQDLKAFRSPISCCCMSIKKCALEKGKSLNFF